MRSDRRPQAPFVTPRDLPERVAVQSAPHPVHHPDRGRGVGEDLLGRSPRARAALTPLPDHPLRAMLEDLAGLVVARIR